jgi:Zn-dependent metalloprotease
MLIDSRRFDMNGLGRLGTLAVALLTAGLAPALAADNPAAEARARANIVNFPGRSLHGPDQTYVARDVIVDANGTEHVRFDRDYMGLRVIGGDMVVHSDANGTLLGVSRTLNRLLMLSPQPSLPAPQAIDAALRSHPGDTQRSRPELVVYARGDVPALAYDVRVYGAQADGTPSEKHVIVDAHRGVVLEAWDDIHTKGKPSGGGGGGGSGGAPTPVDGTGYGFFSGEVTLSTSKLSGGSFELRDLNRGSQYTTDMQNSQFGSGSIFTDADNSWGNSTLSDRQSVGVDAQYGTAVTWDYFKNMHGRSGIGNNGKGAYNRVHYGRNYNNAFWSDACFCMTYGDGDGRTFNPFDSLDVAGHEMTHGVTSRTANLTYSGESGGLNEATSDIFGTMVEFYANNAKDPGDYYIGEQLFVGRGYALRSMIQPSTDGLSADCWYPTLKSLDVHYSSGVANHFFYLLAEGTNSTYGTSPTCLSNDTRVATGNTVLTGIGRDAAAAIWYLALTNYMTSGTSYPDARAATLNAAAQLYGLGSTEYGAVATAWSAVNVD